MPSLRFDVLAVCLGRYARRCPKRPPSTSLLGLPCASCSRIVCSAFVRFTRCVPGFKPTLAHGAQDSDCRPSPYRSPACLAVARSLRDYSPKAPWLSAERYIQGLSVALDRIHACGYPGSRSSKISVAESPPISACSPFRITFRCPAARRYQCQRGRLGQNSQPPQYHRSFLGSTECLRRPSVIVDNKTLIIVMAGRG